MRTSLLSSMESKHCFFRLLMLLGLLSTSVYAWSQTISASDPMLKDNYLTQKRLNPGVIVSPDEYINHLNTFIPAKEKYATQEYINAYLVYNSEKRSPLIKMKHNYFLRAMEFINQEGDTLFLDDRPNIKYVVTEKNVYYRHPTKGYYEVIAGKNFSVMLCMQRDYIVSKRESVTDYSYQDLISTDKLFSIVYVPLDFHQPRQKMLFTKKQSLELIDKYDRIFKPSKIGFIKAFPKIEDEIKSFIKSQSIKFNKSEDVEKLLNYCANLTEATIN